MSSGVTKPLTSRREGIYNVLDYGARGLNDGATSVSDAIERAIAAITAAGRGVLYFPPGRYKTAGGHNLPTNIRIIGEGIGISVIEFDQANAATHCFRKSTTTFADSITLEGFTVNGPWETELRELENRRPMSLQYVRQLFLNHVQVTNNCNMALTAEKCENVSVTDCHVWRSTRDAFNFTDCAQARFSNCSVFYCGDDAFACHISATPLSVLRTSLIVEGCTIVDSSGVKLLGGKEAVVANCVISRPRGYGIIMGTTDSSSNEGNSSAYSLVAANNTISDVINISVYDEGQSSSDAIVFGSVGESGAIALAADGSGGVNDYFANLNNNGSSANHTGGMNWICTGNVVARTLPTVTANYGDMGVGNTYTKTGFANLEMTPSEQNTRGLNLRNNVKNCLINANIFSGCHRGGISFSLPSTNRNTAFRNIRVTENVFFDTRSESGITSNASTDFQLTLLIKDNTFDLDPTFSDPDREPNGKWDLAGNSFPAGINAAFMRGVTIGGNVYRNCFRIFNTSANSIVHFAAEETLRCQPVTIGTSANNIGIAVCPAPARGQYTYIIEDCDPASVTFGQTLNVMVRSSATMPASGYYVQGHFVSNTAAPTITNSKVLIGWLRLTTGSNHVLDTDWAALYYSTVGT